MEDLMQLLAIRQGHFRLESGHHGDLWLDLETLLLKPRRLRPFIEELAERISRLDGDAISDLSREALSLLKWLRIASICNSTIRCEQ